MAALAAPMFVLALLGAAVAADPRPGGQDPTIPANRAPTPEQIRSLIVRMVENQHRNDRAMVEYERIEHVVLHKDGENSELYPTVPNECFPPAREPCGFAQRKAALQFLRRSIDTSCSMRSLHSISFSIPTTV